MGDIKQQSLRQAKFRSEALGLQNLTVMHFDLTSDATLPEFDLGLALHSCGGLCDLVLERCLNHDFVVCPCCFGKMVHLPNEKCKRWSECSDYAEVCNWADSETLLEVAAGAKLLVNTDRLKTLRQQGSEAKLFYLPKSCGSKNTVITNLSWLSSSSVPYS